MMESVMTAAPASPSMSADALLDLVTNPEKYKQQLASLKKTTTDLIRAQKKGQTQAQLDKLLEQAESDTGLASLKLEAARADAKSLVSTATAASKKRNADSLKREKTSLVLETQLEEREQSLSKAETELAEGLALLEVKHTKVDAKIKEVTATLRTARGKLKQLTAALD